MSWMLDAQCLIPSPSALNAFMRGLVATWDREYEKDAVSLDWVTIGLPSGPATLFTIMHMLWDVSLAHDEAIYGWVLRRIFVS